MKRWVLALLALFIMVVSLPSVMALQESVQVPHRLDVTGVNPNDGRTAFVTASVRDSSGQSITGLTAADFAMTGPWAEAGGTITDVESITADNLPLAVVLVIDTSSSMAGLPIELTKSAARSFIESLSDIDSVALASFNDDPVILVDYTTDRATLLNALDNLPFGGQTALYDGAAIGVEIAVRAPYPRRAVVLLSDGAEYGGASLQAREAAREAAIVNGVPVYTIGLGYGTDRSYLSDLAGATNGRFYESPAPEDLPAIYQELATLFRSQYVLTTTFEGALDGKIYPFILSSVSTPTVLDAATFRAPILVPLVSLTPELSAPLGGATTFSAQIRADSPLASVTAEFAGQTQTLTAPYQLTIDPFTLAPADYTLTVTAVDTKGASGTASMPFIVSPEQARLTLDVDLAAMGAITEPVTIVLEGQTQSPATGAEFIWDETTIGAGSGLPATFVIDPMTFTPGIHTAEFVVREESGTETVLAQSVEIAALPPIIGIDGLAPNDVFDAPRTLSVNLGGQSTLGTVKLLADGVEIDTVTGASPLSFDINPVDLFSEGGAHTITLEIINEFGQPATVEIPVTLPDLLFPTPTPTPTHTPTHTPTNTPDLVATAAVQTQSAQATSEQAAAFQRATESAAATLAAVATLDAQSTIDAGSTAVAQANLDAQATLNAQETSTAASIFAEMALATAEAQATSEMQTTIEAELAQLAAFTATAEANAQATIQAEALNAQATVDMESTNAQATTEAESANVQATADAQGTSDADSRAATLSAGTSVASTRGAVQAAAFQAQTSTANAPTATPEPTATFTDEPTATATNTPTPTLTDEPTATPTPTDEPTATPTDISTPTLAPTETPFDPTSTPVSLTDVVAEAAQAPEFTPILAVLFGVGILILIIVTLIVLRRRRNE